MSPIEGYVETEENAEREEKDFTEEKEEKDRKEPDIPENANTEKISMETLLRVFRGGSEVKDANRFTSHLKTENIYAEVGEMKL